MFYTVRWDDGGTVAYDFNNETDAHDFADYQREQGMLDVEVIEGEL